MKELIELEDGGGGKKSEELISKIRKILSYKGKWKNTEDDGAVFNLNKEKIIFTTDGFIVDPIFFPGGDIGKIAITGTINDLLVMGADPVGISLSIIIEEGFPVSDLEKIIKSIDQVSRETSVPIVTGDTKTTEKGKLDKIEITTAGIGMAKEIISNSGANVGDYIITSGDLGEHAVALLASRFNYKTKIKSDCHAFFLEMKAVQKYLHAAKDPTRGGLAAILNEMAFKSRVKVVLQESDLPFKKETVAVSELLGIDKLAFPSEGRFVASVPQSDVNKVIKILRRYNREAKIIGRVEKGKGVWLKTSLGSMKKIDIPEGKLIPRIC